MKKPIFALIPSGYKASKLYTPIPINGEGDFTTTRTSVAHRMNKDGYLEEVDANVPRLDYDGTTKKIYKNLLPFSSNSIYWGIGANVNFNQIEGVNPFGKSTDELYSVALVSTTSHQIEIPFIELTVGETYTISVYLKSNSSESFQIAYYDSGSQVIGDIITTIGDSQWHRYSVTILIPSGTVATPRVRLNGFSNGTTGATYQFFGVQAELGSIATDYESTKTDLGYETIFKLAKCPSLLVEDAATNLMPYSEDFTQGWSNVNILDTANAEVSPDGKLNGTKLERTITGASYTSQSFSKAASSITYTSSIFVKQGDTPYFAVRSQGSYPARVDLRFEFATKSFYYTNANTFTDLTYNVEEYKNGWFRLSWTYTTDTHTSLTGVSMSPKHLDSDTDGTDLNYGYAYVWGAQTEEFNNATSYIKTLATSATRASDVTETLPILGDIVNSKKGTMYAEIASTDDLGTIQGVRLGLDGNRTNNSIRFLFSPLGKIRVIYRVASTSTLDWSAVSDIKQLQKFSISWSEDRLSVVVNGVAVANLPFPYLLGGLNILDVYGGVRVKDWKIWDEVLTDDELIKLTT